MQYYGQQSGQLEDHRLSQLASTTGFYRVKLAITLYN